jgi:hypothetical protein
MLVTECMRVKLVSGRVELTITRLVESPAMEVANECFRSTVERLGRTTSSSAIVCENSAFRRAEPSFRLQVGQPLRASFKIPKHRLARLVRPSTPPKSRCFGSDASREF